MHRYQKSRNVTVTIYWSVRPWQWHRRHRECTWVPRVSLTDQEKTNHYDYDDVAQTRTDRDCPVDTANYWRLIYLNRTNLQLDIFYSWITYMNYRWGDSTRCSRKNCTKFKHHNIATVHHRLMPFSAKCSERKCLHDKGQCLNTAIKYSLLFSWQVNYLKTKQSTHHVLLSHWHIRDRFGC